MALVVNNNIAALNAQRNVGTSQSKLAKSIERLSSGLRINRAADDAAGLAIATKFNAQVKGLNQAVRNANNAISLVQTAESGITTLTNVLQRLRELSVQSSSDDNTPTDRATLTSEADNLVAEFTRISNTTEFNTMTLLNGTFSNKYFQVGANYSQQITFNIGDARGKSLGARAEYSADVTDGVINSTNANFGAGEFKINTYDVAATASADDQYSVLDLSSGAVNVTQFSIAGYSVRMVINGTSFTVSASQDVVGSGGSATANALAAVIVSAINAASITNVTARQLTDSYTSMWVLEATGGTTLDMALSTTGSVATIASAIGFAGASASALWGASVASTVVNYNGQSSAIAKAVAISAIKTDTQVTATAYKNVVTGGSAMTARTIHSGDIYINGVDIGAVALTASDSTGALISAINNQTGSTGVVATKDTNGKLVLTAADGRNISVTGNDSADLNAVFGSSFVTSYATNNSMVFRSTVKLNSEDNITLSGTLSDLYDGGTTDALNMTKTTDTSKSQATDLATYNVAALQIDTQEEAQAAILTIDAALNDLNNLRSQIGAIQNRLVYTVDNLQVSSENMSASGSRITDADFAEEVTMFTKNQIMVQAGTAILAQANTLPQMALSLLK